jgi:hypothetical protein
MSRMEKLRQTIENRTQNIVNEPPHEAKSLEEFKAMIWDLGGSEVSARPVVTEIPQQEFPDINYQPLEYATKFSTKGRDGREIIFTEEHGEDFKYINNILDQEVPNIRGIVTAEERLRMLSKKIPGIVTHGPLEDMDDETRKKFEEITKKNPIVVFEAEKPPFKSQAEIK